MHILRGNKSLLFAAMLVLLALACSAFIESYHNQYVAGLENAHADAVSDKLSDVTAEVEYIVNSAVFLANTIPSYLALKNNPTEADLELLAGNIIDKSDYIEKIALSEGTRVVQIYPRAGNESVIGLDIAKKGDEAKYARLAITHRKPVISEQVKLVQGGNAFIGFIPTWMKDEFWGLTSVVYNSEKMLSDAGFYQLSQNYHVAVKYTFDGHDTSHLIYGSEEVFSQSVIVNSVKLPFGEWQVAVIPPGDWFSELPMLQRYQARLLGYGILVMACTLLVVAYCYHRKIESLSLRDELTGLPNRRYMLAVLENAVQRGASFTLMNLDLNKFKQINDNYGHDAGDQVLIGFARAVSGALRKSDMICRQGGDEFLIMLPRVTKELDIDHVIHKLRTAIDDMEVCYHGLDLKVSATIGYAVSRGDVIDVEQLLHRADTNMYQKKRSQGKVIPFSSYALR